MHTANQFKKGLTPASPPAAAAPRVVAGPPPVRTPTPAPRGTPSGQRATAQRSQPLRVASKDVTTISAAEQFSAELMQAEAGLAGGSGDGGQLQETMVALQEQVGKRHSKGSRSAGSAGSNAQMPAISVERRKFRRSAKNNVPVVRTSDLTSPRPASPRPLAWPSQIADLTRQIDALYDGAFSSSLPRLASEWASSPSASESEQQQQQQPDASLLQCPLTEAKFGELGRVAPPLMRALVSGKEKGDPAGWLAFQTSVHSLKLQRSRLEAQLADVTSLLTSAAREAAKQDAELMRQSEEPQAGGSSAAAAAASAGKRTINIVLISGFESFNVALYKQVATQLRNSLGFVRLSVFSDRDIASRPADVAAALDSADAFFGSLLFDFDQVEWLRARTERIPIRLVFESALELMSTTQLGSFNMAQAPGGGGQKAGPPPVVKKVLSMFGSQREEDRMVGYLSFLKLGPKLLQWVPGQKAQDLKHWLTIYSYWYAAAASS